MRNVKCYITSSSTIIEEEKFKSGITKLRFKNKNEKQYDMFERIKKVMVEKEI